MNENVTYSLYDGDVELVYNDAKHTYEVDGVRVPSTTTITGVLDKPALIFWALNEAVKWLEHQWLEGKKYTQKQIDYLLKESKFAHKKTSKTATDIGSEAHLWAEEFLQYRLDNDHDESYIPPMPEDERVLSSVNAFLEWYRAHDVRVLGVEQKVYSKTHNYSGTFDLLAVIDGRLTIADWKSSKSIYPEYYLQGAGYVLAYEEEQAYIGEKTGTQPEFREIEDVAVIRIPKDGSDFEVKTITDLEPHKKAFLACREIYNWKETKH